MKFDCKRRNVVISRGELHNAMIGDSLEDLADEEMAILQIECRPHMGDYKSFNADMRASLDENAQGQVKQKFPWLSRMFVRKVLLINILAILSDISLQCRLF